MDFAGMTIEWRGFLRSETVSEFMGLWMRQDGDAPNLAFASMQPRQIRGTNDWTEYSITLPVDREAKQLVFGVLFAGTGKVWADDLRLLVDGRPVWEAPKVERLKRLAGPALFHVKQFTRNTIACHFPKVSSVRPTPRWVYD